jgi:sarcosine oxidase
VNAPARYDVIVVGVGGMGSSACLHLARRGLKVLGLEHFEVAHDRGSSHGINRIIRLAYHEHPSYVPLLRRSYELWRELQRDAGERLLYVTGAIDASAPDDELVHGSLRSCELHGLQHTVYTGAELALRFPGLRLPDDHVAVYQPDGGFVAAGQSVVAHVRLAREAGAEIHVRERVLGWDCGDHAVSVRTDTDDYTASRLVISAGAWLAELVPALQPLARPERQVLGWFEPFVPEYFEPGRFPVFNVAVEEGRYYGLPVFGVPGLKLGRYHHLGESIASPDDWERETDAADEAALRPFLERYLPEAAGPLLAAKTCLFTNTPDEHFIVDWLPGESRVLVVSPCSGHGFKFCPVMGEAVAELVADGATRHDLSLFGLARFAPYFQPPPSAR